MRKVKFLVASLLFCAMSYAGYMGYERMTMSEAERFMEANVEALTSGESGGNDGWVYCRCHDDKHCYVGNKISFRAACVRLFNASNCDDYKKQCPPAGIN